MPSTKHGSPVLLNGGHCFVSFPKVIFLIFKAKQQEKLHVFPDKIFPFFLGVHLVRGMFPFFNFRLALPA